jgi:hypothetical protein
MKYKLLNFKFLFTASIIFFGLFGLAKSSLAADYYFAQSVAGSANGTSCANAYAIGDGSSTGASSSTYWVAGNTLHLCGTITGSAGATAVSASGSGTSGSPITIKFESGASLQAPYWGTGGAIGLSTYNYITVDGGATGQIGGINGNSANVIGFIENTSNGTSGSASCPSGSCSYQEPSYGIYWQGSSNIIIKNLGIYNLYVRTSTTDDAIDNVGVVGIYDSNNITYVTNNLLITNCLIHDMPVGIYVYYGSDTNIDISFNTLYHINWGGSVSSAGSGSLTNFSLHDNWFYNWVVWDDTAGDSYHHNGWYTYQQSDCTMNGIYWYNNTLGPGYSNSTCYEGSSCQTSGLFLDTTGGGTLTGGYIFNNIFESNSLTQYPSNGYIALWPTSGDTLMYILNNTFVGGNVDINCGNFNTTVENNIATGGNEFMAIYNATVSPPVSLTSNYNLIYNSSSTPFIYSMTSSAGSPYTLAAWQTFSGQDENDVTTSPNLSATYSLNAGSPAIGAGANLASLGITGTTATNSVCTGSGTPLSGCTGTGTGSYGTYSLATDLAGVARPSTGAWDIGAYEYSSGSSDTTPPAAPSGLSVN